MRAFLAVEVPEAVRRGMVGVQESLAPRLRGVRWVRLQAMHLTLIFLGEIEEEVAGNLSEAARRACTGIRAGSAWAHGLGCYPGRGSPRVIWVGIRQDAAETLSCLHRALRPAAEQLGIVVEARPFSPHLTLGRARSRLGRDQVQEAISRHPPVDLGEIPIQACVLFRSTLGPEGPRYERRAVLELTG